MPQPTPIDLAQARRSLAVAIWTVLALAGAVLVARRFSGEFSSLIPGSLAFVATALIALATWSAWCCHAAGPPPLSRWQRLVPQILSVSVTALWAWSISANATPLTGGSLFAVVLLQAAVFALQETESDFLSLVRLVPVEKTPRPKTVVSEQFATIVTEPTIEAPRPIDRHSIDEHDEAVEETDDTQTLWLARRLTEEGEEVEGWARIHFAAGQRETIVHVAFCPPLVGAPEVETEDLDGAGLEIRVAASFPFGARLAVRRSGALDESPGDRIGFVARAASANRAA